MEVLAAGFVVDGLVHRLDNRRSERFRDVADAEANDLGVRIRLLMGGNAVRDLGEQIACLNLRIILVDV